MQSSTDNQLREQAHKRVEFKRHLMVYSVFMGAMWIIWALTSRSYPWPVWPMAGWGIGLLFHYLFEYRPSRFFSEDEEYRRLKRRTDQPTHYSE